MKINHISDQQIAILRLRTDMSHRSAEKDMDIVGDVGGGGGFGLCSYGCPFIVPVNFPKCSSQLWHGQTEFCFWIRLQGLQSLTK